MAQATIDKVSKDALLAYVWATVAGDGPGGVDVQYQASTPLVDAQGQTKSLSQLKTELVAGLKAQRDQSKATQTAVAISGAVTL